MANSVRGEARRCGINVVVSVADDEQSITVQTITE
jgi:hypothetical protein